MAYLKAPDSVIKNLLEAFGLSKSQLDSCVSFKLKMVADDLVTIDLTLLATEQNLKDATTVLKKYVVNLEEKK